MRQLSLCATMAALVFAAGCASLDRKVAGEWHQESKSKDIFANAALQHSAKDMLSFTDDHKFVLSTAVVRDDPKQGLLSSTTVTGIKIEGTWETEDGQILFHTETAGGQTVAEIKKEEAAQEAEIKEKATIPEPPPPPDPGPNGTLNIHQESPEDQQKLADLNNSLQKLELSMVPKTPIPTAGKLSDKGTSITVTLDNGQTLLFAR